MTAGDWLGDTRDSYDRVAESYAAQFPDGLGPHPQVRGVLALFAEALGPDAGPVLDAGCGTGLVTAHLAGLGFDVLGIDLSPGMLAVARRDHPGLRFEPGSMTDLALPDRSVGGVLAFYSLIHLPDAELPGVLAGFLRVLRPGGVVMLGFHVGDEQRLKTEGYGGHPMRVQVNLRPVERMADLLRDAGFRLEAQVLLDPDDPVPGGVLLARRPSG